MSIEQEKMLMDRLHTKILKNIAEIVTQDEINAFVNAKYRITKVKPQFDENNGTCYCPDCKRELKVNYDLHCSKCGLPIDYSDITCNTPHIQIGNNVNINAEIVDYNESLEKAKVKITGYGEDKRTFAEKYLWIDYNNMK